jgi:hypothetical protein
MVIIQEIITDAKQEDQRRMRWTWFSHKMWWLSKFRTQLVPLFNAPRKTPDSHQNSKLRRPMVGSGRNHLLFPIEKKVIGSLDSVAEFSISICESSRSTGFV